MVTGVVEIGLRERVADVRSERRAVVNTGARHATPIDSHIVHIVAERAGEQGRAATADGRHQRTRTAVDRQRTGGDTVAAVRPVSAAGRRRSLVERLDQTAAPRRHRRLVPAELRVRRRVADRRREQAAVAPGSRHSGRLFRQLGRIAGHRGRTKQPAGLLHLAGYVHDAVTTSSRVQCVQVGEDMIAVTSTATVIGLNPATHHRTGVSGHVLRVAAFLFESPH